MIRTMADYLDLPRRIGLRGYQVSAIEYFDRPGLITLEFWHPQYTRWRQSRAHRTRQRIAEYLAFHKPVALMIQVVLRQGPKPDFVNDWEMAHWYRPQHANCRSTPRTELFINGKPVGEVLDFKPGRKAIQGEWIERCDVCGKKLDQMAGEDFFVEDRSGGHVFCAKHWREREEKNDGRDDQGN